MRAPVLDVIALHAARRAVKVAGWSSDRGWPLGRIREAWVVWRYGGLYAAEHSAARAGTLESDDRARLQRAVTRYERHAAARPDGFPEHGLAALAQIARVADERDARPQTLHSAIRVLDQLSRRMRASATADDPARREHQAARARRRRGPGQAPGALVFRCSVWPLWVALDDHGNPILVNGELQLVDQLPGIVPAPDRDDPWYVQTLRDAHLLAGLWPPLKADGRATMALGDDHNPEREQRRARPGPYEPPADHRVRPEPEDLELARLAGISLRAAQCVDVDTRDRLLKQLRAERIREHSSERAELWERIHAATNRGLPRDADM
jgi:hypothetical protein